MKFIHILKDEQDIYVNVAQIQDIKIHHGVTSFYIKINTRKDTYYSDPIDTLSEATNRLKLLVRDAANPNPLEKEVSGINCRITSKSYIIELN